VAQTSNEENVDRNELPTNSRQNTSAHRPHATGPSALHQRPTDHHPQHPLEGTPAAGYKSSIKDVLLAGHAPPSKVVQVSSIQDRVLAHGIQVFQRRREGVGGSIRQDRDLYREEKIEAFREERRDLSREDRREKSQLEGGRVVFYPDDRCKELVR